MCSTWQPLTFGVLTKGSNCGTTQTPLWRRSPQGATICNACGLYQKARNAARPTSLKKPPNVVSTGPSRPSPAKGASPSSSKATPNVPGATYVAASQMPKGTCPGGGRCNGTGGAEGCYGCPAYNNRMSKSTHVNVKGKSTGCGFQAAEPSRNDSEIDVNALQSQSSDTAVVIACQNCNTTITPLWRRDEAGHTICNACGKGASFEFYGNLADNTRTLLQASWGSQTSYYEEGHHQAKKTRDSCRPG